MAGASAAERTVVAGRTATAEMDAWIKARFGISMPSGATPVAPAPAAPDTPMPDPSAWRQANAAGLAALRAAISQTGLSGPAAGARKRLIGAARVVGAALQAGDTEAASVALRGAAGDLQAQRSAGRSVTLDAPSGTA